MRIERFGIGRFESCNSKPRLKTLIGCESDWRCWVDLRLFCCDSTPFWASRCTSDSGNRAIRNLRFYVAKVVTVDFKKHPARKVRIWSGHCGLKVPGRFAFPSARNPRTQSISRFRKTSQNSLAFPRLVLRKFQTQQHTYGVVSEGFFCGTFCGNSAEHLRKLAQMWFIVPGKSVEIPRRLQTFLAEIRTTLVENCLQWPLPERPHKWIADKQIRQSATAFSSFLTDSCSWWKAKGMAGRGRQRKSDDNSSQEQQLSHVSKAKTEMRHSCLRRYKTRCTPVNEIEIASISLGFLGS